MFSSAHLFLPAAHGHGCIPPAASTLQAAILTLPPRGTPVPPTTVRLSTLPAEAFLATAASITEPPSLTSWTLAPAFATRHTSGVRLRPPRLIPHSRRR